jgi:hypothetical protein
MTLDLLMAFTLSDDHAAQEAAWFDRPDWQRSAHAIRQTLTGLNLYGAFDVKRFSLSSAQSSILFKFLRSVGEPFLCPGLHPGSEPRGAAVNIAVGTAGGGAKRG